MRQASDVLRDFIGNLKLPLTVREVQDLGGGQQKLFVDSTQYLNTNMSFDLLGESRKVLSFEADNFVVIEGGATVPVGEYPLAPPYFVHGKYMAVNEELANIPDMTTWNPLVWMIELNERSVIPSADARLESDGVVRLFIMSSSDWENFDTEAHYREVIRPLSNIIDAMRTQFRRNLKYTPIKVFTSTNHAKFTTGAGEIADNRGGKGLKSVKKVLPDTQSGIELSMSLPIIKCIC